jgi:hypothetical protein
MTDDLLCRDMPYELRANEGGEGDGLTLEGYAAVFNSPTRIDSWEGTFDEEIAPGAFARSLRERTPVRVDRGGRARPSRACPSPRQRLGAARP